MFLVVLAIFYFLLLAWAISTIARSPLHGIKKTEAWFAFGIKVAAGCLYGYLFLTYYNGDDTWDYNRRSIEEYKKLVNDPLLFISELSPASAFRAAKGIWQSIDFYIMDLEDGIMIKMLGVFNIFSRGNYYINIIFFNFVSFWGHYWLFRLLVEKFPDRRTILFCGIFLFLPVVFWVSGIRADGLLLFFVALLFFQYNRWLAQRHRRAIGWVMVALLGILIFRNVLCLLLLPALLAWFLSHRFNIAPLKSFAVVYLVSAFIFFASAWLPGSDGLPGVVVKKQQRYLSLKGNTRFALDSLRPDVGSFVTTAPQAINNTVVRPVPWEAKGMLQLISSLENIFMLTLLVFFLFRKEQKWTKRWSDPALMSMLFFAISLYVFIGLTVPFPGAIVRYKTIPELILLTLLLVAIKLPSTKRI